MAEQTVELTEIIPVGDFEDDDLLRLAASAEQNSEHPLAAALVNAAKPKTRKSN